MSDLSDLKTLADFVRWGASRFSEAGLVYGHGTDNAADEAFFIVRSALQLAPDAPDYFWNCRLTGQEKDKLAALFRRRIDERISAAYLLGEAWFMGLPFYVDENVLVPRSPIAELLDQRCEPWVDPAHVRQVLDLCTGSGCIAVGAAQSFPGARVDASDISEGALRVAQKNLKRHGLEEQIRLLHSDLFESIPEARYQLILSNPPYVDARSMQSLPPEFRHEPGIGLAAGDDGLEFARRILVEAPRYLDDDGVLVVEVGESADMLMQAYPDVPFTWLDFEHGGKGVFVLTAQELRASHAALARAS